MPLSITYREVRDWPGNHFLLIMVLFVVLRHRTLTVGEAEHGDR